MKRFCVAQPFALGFCPGLALGEGSRTLNFLLIELAFSHPDKRKDVYFVRLHRRCTIYELLNSYGANGEDSLSLGY